MPPGTRDYGPPLPRTSAARSALLQAEVAHDNTDPLEGRCRLSPT